MIIPAEDIKILKRLITLFDPYKKRTMTIIACLLISSGINIFLPFIGKKIIDEGLMAKDFSKVVMFSLISMLVLLAAQLIGVLETRLRAIMNSEMSYTLSKDSFKHILKLKLQYFNNVNFAEIMNNIGMDVGNICRITDRGTFYIITSIFNIIGGIVALGILDWRLTCIIIFIIPMKYFLTKYLARKRRQLFEKSMEYNKEYSAWYGDTIAGIREVKLWGTDRIKLGQFIKNRRNILKIEISLAIIDKLNELSESFLFDAMNYILYILGAYMVFNFKLTIGGLFAFITYSIFVIAPVSALLNIGYNFSNILPSAKRFFEFMDMQQETGKAKGLITDISSIKGDIRFENVSFSYGRRDEVLKGINLEINAGQKVAIIGINGSGKSSLTELLLRFYSPDNGRILLDGKDIRDYRLKEYRSLISVVSQEIYLFNGTIKENINTNRQYDEFRVQKAAMESAAHGFIDRLPEKYATKVGRNGTALSGGERQKIAMARAFARDFRILVLDEATSNYDIDSEAYVNKLLCEMQGDRTIITITHKPQLLKQMDKVILLGRGCIIDSGKHGELYDKSEIYRDMVKNSGHGKDKRAV